MKALPAAERIDIVNELKSEMIELSDKGISGEQIVNRLGNPKVWPVHILQTKSVK